ncbi:MAG: hypothetical protein WC091_04655 [Sulfuricellaceae bacterium]
MSAITFDTLKFAERLEKAGATHELATAMIEVQKESLAEAMDAQLATKSDIRDVRSDVLKLETSVKGDIQRLDYEIRLLKWMVGLSVALSTGILALLARLIFTLPH